MGELLLERLALCDVAGVQHDPADVLVVEQVGVQDLELARLAVAMAQRALDHLPVAARVGGAVGEQTQQRAGVLLRDEAVEARAEQLLGRVAEDVLGGGALVGDRRVAPTTVIRSLEFCTSEAKRASLRCAWISSVSRAPSSASASWVASASQGSARLARGSDWARQHEQAEQPLAYGQREHDPRYVLLVELHRGEHRGLERDAARRACIGAAPATRGDLLGQRARRPVGLVVARHRGQRRRPRSGTALRRPGRRAAGRSVSARPVASPRASHRRRARAEARRAAARARPTARAGGPGRPSASRPGRTARPTPRSSRSGRGRRGAAP